MGRNHDGKISDKVNSIAKGGNWKQLYTKWFKIYMSCCILNERDLPVSFSVIASEEGMNHIVKYIGTMDVLLCVVIRVGVRLMPCHMQIVGWLQLIN